MSLRTPPSVTMQPMIRAHRQLHVVAPSASPAEAAAIVAALERFVRDTAPEAPARPDDLDRWRRVAMLEGVARKPEGDEGDSSSPWINT
jgi:hypothetical protein